MTPPDCLLHDYHYMPIMIARLFGSEFHARANDSEWRAGVTLWLKSWHQSPAASLPDDDELLARLAEFGRDVKGWLRVKAMALHGWQKGDDGRLYHPVIADLALQAWRQKRKRVAQTKAARDARIRIREEGKEGEEGEEGRTDIVTRSVTESVTDIVTEQHSADWTLDECLAAAPIAMPREMVEAFHQHYDRVGWVTGSGRRIVKLAPALAKWKAEQPNRTAEAGRAGKPAKLPKTAEKTFDAVLNNILADAEHVSTLERETWLEALWDKYKDVPKAYAGHHVVTEARRRLRKKWEDKEGGDA